MAKKPRHETGAVDVSTEALREQIAGCLLTARERTQLLTGCLDDGVEGDQQDQRAEPREADERGVGRNTSALHIHAKAGRRQHGVERRPGRRRAAWPGGVNRPPPARHPLG